MNYSDSIGEASESMRLALPLMSKHKIPIDPMNYAVWYEHVSGKNQKLTDAIKQISDKVDEFPLGVSRDLFNRYISLQSDSDLDEVGDGLRKIMTGLLKNIIDAGGETSQFSKLLQNSSSQLKDAEVSTAVQGVVETILTEATKMEESGKQLQKQLIESSNEIEELRLEVEKVREQASIDMLTKVANRRTFDETLLSNCKEAEISQKALSLIMVDVDKFKQINDNFGHIVGDGVIKTVALILKNKAKSKDLVARFGGDEFAIILPNTNLTSALTIANNICTYVNTKRFTRKNKTETIGKVTLSMGVTCYKSKESMEQFIGRADAALYQSKKAGRNRATGT